MIFSEEIDEILRHGVPLFDQGINNWALSSSQCMSAINELEKKQIAILGGDTYLNGTVNPNGDSWFCSQKNNEDKISYIKRSSDMAVSFVKNPVYENYKFILTPKL